MAAAVVSVEGAAVVSVVGAAVVSVLGAAEVVVGAAVVVVVPPQPATSTALTSITAITKRKIDTFSLRLDMLLL